MRVQVDRSEWREVPTLAEASRVLREYIDGQNMGGNEWYGRIRSIDGAKVQGHATAVRISYNGRCWDKTGREVLP